MSRKPSVLSMKTRLVAVTLGLVLSAQAASAAECLNRFVSRVERQMQVVTLLTGKFTFQEAQAMAKTARLEWVNESGKTIAKQFGELKVVRPMPVGCDGKPSGVVMIASFGPTIATPSKKMHVKFDRETTVVFDQQSQ